MAKIPFGGHRGFWNCNRVGNRDSWHGFLRVWRATLAGEPVGTVRKADLNGDGGDDDKHSSFHCQRPGKHGRWCLDALTHNLNWQLTWSIFRGCIGLKVRGPVARLGKSLLAENRDNVDPGVRVISGVKYAHAVQVHKRSPCNLLMWRELLQSLPRFGRSRRW